MPITYHWNSEAKYLMVITFDGTWTWDDFHNQIKDIHKEIEIVSHTADMLLWHKVAQPLGNPLIHFNSAARQQPANTGMVIVVAPPYNSAAISFLLSLSSIVRKIYPTKSVVTIVMSLAEAEKLLGKKVDTRISLPVMER